jgi:hypothetical protein
MKKCFFTYYNPDPNKQISLPDPDPQIINELARLVDDSIPGSKIYVSIYLFEERPADELINPVKKLVDSLIKASKQGRNIEILYDDNTRNDGVYRRISCEAPEIIQEKIIAGRQTNDELRDNSRSYKGTKNHFKLILFSETLIDGVAYSNVVAQTSCNFTLNDCKKFQDLIVFDDKVVFKALVSYLEEMKALNRNFIDYVYKAVEGPNIKAYLLPKNKEKGDKDTIALILNNIDKGPAKIYILMSEWSGNRTEIAAALRNCYCNGAAVKILLRDSQVGANELNDLRGSRFIIQRIKKYQFGPSDCREITHSKFMLLKCDYNGRKDCKIVITGSHNYTSPALYKNNETLFKFIDDDTFDKYLTYFNHVKSLDEGLPNDKRCRSVVNLSEEEIE